jgi:crotonobetainyl-CoA:carnitine CoA-transferase CaiB-like acyl-CoA transferase
VILATEGYTLIDGKVPKDVWDDLAGLYPTRDGHVRIHTNFPQLVFLRIFFSLKKLILRSHRQGILSLLQCEGTRSAVGEALLQQNSVEFETAATAAGMCVSAIRSFDEWDSHPQSQVYKGKLPIELVKIGDAPPKERKHSLLPLEGIKVLELTRVVAGPVAGRTLATNGAEVLWVTSPRLPSLPVLDIDTSRGKRAAQLDLNESGSTEKLYSLIKIADVFLQSYRPGGLEERGFGPTDLARLNPGIIVANLRAYGWEGPWAGKRAVSVFRYI